MARSQSKIEDGRSLQNKTLNQLMSETDFRVVGVMEITNSTPYTLENPSIRTDGGQIRLYPQYMDPFTRDAVVVHKYPGTATGSYGTLSYYIKDLECRIILMWSLPFNHDFYSNWLALDVRKQRRTNHTMLFKEMYNGKNVKEYFREIEETELTEHGVKLTASMASSHRAHIKLKVEPSE